MYGGSIYLKMNNIAEHVLVPGRIDFFVVIVSFTAVFSGARLASGI